MLIGRVLACCTGVVFFLVACVSYQPLSHSEPLDKTEYTLESMLNNVVFSPTDWPEELTADLYLPKKTGRRPVVVTIHGGGWANRSRSDMEDISEKLVERGYAVFNISYRFAPTHIFPAQLLDTQHALAWLAANADQYRLDANRISVWGYSAGAHLGALAASISADEPVAQVDSALLPRVHAVVAGGISANLTVYRKSPIIERFIGGKRDDMPETFAMASPFFHISENDPPVFLYHGKRDGLVEVEQAVDYQAALQAAGIKAELYLHNWWGRIAMFLFGGDAENRAIDFLDRQNHQSG